MKKCDKCIYLNKARSHYFYCEHKRIIGLNSRIRKNDEACDSYSESLADVMPDRYHQTIEQLNRLDEEMSSRTIDYEEYFRKRSILINRRRRYDKKAD